MRMRNYFTILTSIFLAASRSASESQEWSKSVVVSAPPILSILEPKAGTIFVPGQGDVPLAVDLQVQHWCSADGGEDCAPLTELVICFFVRHLRMFCSPLLSNQTTPVSITLATEHLPGNSFEIEARLLWVPLLTPSLMLSSSAPVLLSKLVGSDASCSPLHATSSHIAGKYNCASSSLIPLTTTNR